MAHRDVITTAIILAAGMGTRLRDKAVSKPLCEVAGKPLIDHALERLAAAGLTRAIVVTGYEAERIEAHLDRPQPLAVETVRTRDWQRAQWRLRARRRAAASTARRCC